MVYVALAVTLILVSVLGVLLNGYIIIVVLLSRQVVSANNILLLHLGVVDTILGALFLAYAIPGLNKNNWLADGIPCSIQGFLFSLLHPLVLWTVCGLNCDRYYAIAAPLHYGHLVSPKKVFVGLGAGWIVALTLCVPPLFAVAPYKYNYGLEGCAPDFSSGKGVLWHSAAYTAFTLLLPATLLICCNLKILMIARYHRHRIASAIYEVTLSAQVTITHQRNPFFVPVVTAPSSGGPKFRGPSAIHTVFQILSSFLILYLPYYCAILWEASSSTFDRPTKVNPHVFTAASALLTCSPPVNGFLYGVKNKSLKKTFQNYWRKKLTKSEVNQEINARTPSTCGSRRPSLTPLGFFAKPTIHRRLSEALLDVHKVVNSPQRPTIKRISSELAWRPNSTTDLNLSPNEGRLPQTASCNTLQVPRVDSDDVSVIGDEEILKKKYVDHPRGAKPSLILHRLFGSETDQRTKKAVAVRNVLEGTPKRSPRIMITRAYSEDSDKNHSHPASPAKEVINRKHSNSATVLIERKWRQLRGKDEEEADRGKTTPLLDSSISNRSSDSSENSEIYMALDEKVVANTRSDAAEDDLLLSWPREGRKRPPLVKQARSLTHSNEIVL